MRFRLTVSVCFEAATIGDALLIRRDSHHAVEELMTDRTILDPDPDPQLHEFNLSRGMLDGLDEESSEALKQHDEYP